ncbi:PaaI family thioesterase [Sandarakinorhabdus sp. DWP1-3-1]|uniref:PaaI family thioesterase n=1 Tax=Sandarakinorhabdus sp. DWP1-3-1 TaxID=2804627 RepID=UPI003CF3D379
MDAETRAAVVQMVPFSAHLGFDLEVCEREKVVVSVLLRAEYCTAGGTAHGGFLMTLADFAGAAGAMQVLPEGAKGTTTIDSKTNMIGAAPVGSRLVATSTLVHAGRRTSVWTTRVETDGGKLISLTTQTQMVL